MLSMPNIKHQRTWQSPTHRHRVYTREGNINTRKILSWPKSLFRLFRVCESVMSNSLQPHGLWPARLLCPWNSPNKSVGLGSPSLLQGIFPTQGSNQGLPRGMQILYHLSHQGRHKWLWKTRKNFLANPILPSAKSVKETEVQVEMRMFKVTSSRPSWGCGF